MSLKRRETSETQFIEILKSKHARYVDGGVLVSKEMVDGDFLPPGTVLGQVTEEDHPEQGKYGPVTRGKFTELIALAKKFVMKEEQSWNFKSGDLLEVLGLNGAVADVASGSIEVVSVGVSGTDEVVEVDATWKADLTVIAGGGYIQKTDGTSKAKAVCTHSVEFDGGEDAFVGGIVHGAVHKDRLPNYDELVDNDLPLVSFE